MIRLVLVLASMTALGLCGCGASGGGPGGVLNQLAGLPDADGDGFAEITPPDGVTFDPENTLSMKLTNSITRGEAQAASGVSAPGVVTDSVALTVDTAVTLDYGDAGAQTLRGSFPLGPKELLFEVACPQGLEVLVTAVADSPVTTPQAVETFGPYSSAQGDGLQAFQCGELFSLQTFASEDSGELVASVVVE